MQSSEQKAKQKKNYVGFSLKQRLLPVLLIALAISFTVFFVGPFEIYQSNSDFFEFSLSDFLGWNLLYGLVTLAAVVGILLPLRGKAFDVALALSFWIALMLMVQGNYLNFGISSLEGDGVGAGISTSAMIINTVIWLVVGAACLLAVLLIHAKHRDWIRTVAIIAMLTVIGMQAMTLAITSLTTDVWQKKTVAEDNSEQAPPKLLTYENLDQVSSGKNVVWFVIDRFDVSSYEDHALKDCPEIFEHLDGFTYYNNTVSLYSRTYPSVPYMLTGRDYDFKTYQQFHASRLDYFEEAYTNAPFLKTLSENNYNVNIYTDDHYGYSDARHMEGYISNASGVGALQAVNTHRLAWDMTRLSLYRYLPTVTKGLTGKLSTPQFKQYVQYQTDYPVFTTDMKDAYEFFNENPLVIDAEKNNFAYIHIAGCHLPNLYNQDFTPANEEERNSETSAMIQSFKIINLYLKQLKELGLYENATIIITGDHGNATPSYPLESPHVPALFIKESGSAGTALKISSAPVTQGDILPTILASEGIQSNIDFGDSRPVSTVAENEARTRYCLFDGQIPNGTGGELIYFEITGSARDLSNWKIKWREG